MFVQFAELPVFDQDRAKRFYVDHILEEIVMKMNTYVNFSGTCAKAFRYYEKHLAAKVGMIMTHGQSPDQSRVKPEWKDAVLHARISIGDIELWAADIPNAEPMRSAYLTLRMDTDSEAERAFSALSNGGKVLMPMREEFFASRFGQVRDRFGINWMISPRASYAAAGVRIGAVKPTLRRDTDHEERQFNEKPVRCRARKSSEAAH